MYYGNNIQNHSAQGWLEHVCVRVTTILRLTSWSESLGCRQSPVHNFEPERYFSWFLLLISLYLYNFVIHLHPILWVSLE